jgi:RNA polymerase sigma factor (sigma-70 family)
VTVSSLPPSAYRHPLCVSSGCHNSPADTIVLASNDDAPGNRLDAAFQSERGRLLSYFRRQVGIEAAPDLVQEIYVRAAGSPQSNRLANPAGFLQRIARNLVIDRARRVRSSGVTLLPLDEHRDAASLPEQEWGIEAADLLASYQAAVDGLPEKTRRVFLMHRVEELSYRAIHEALGISISTVEYHMVKALTHIAREVGVSR